MGPQKCSDMTELFLTPQTLRIFFNNNQFCYCVSVVVGVIMLEIPHHPTFTTTEQTRKYKINFLRKLYELKIIHLEFIERKSNTPPKKQNHILVSPLFHQQSKAFSSLRCLKLYKTTTKKRSFLENKKFSSSSGSKNKNSQCLFLS